MPFRKEMAVAGLAALLTCGAISAGVKSPMGIGERVDGGLPGEWPSPGRDYKEQHFSPLAKINGANVEGLGLDWHYDFGDRQGLESTPIVYNGIIYVSTDFSEVWAFDARSGKKLWNFIPDTRYWQINTCCSPANRGVAVWGNKVFVGALDGSLIALNATTGKMIWATQTFPKTTRLSITGAPRVIKGVVIIGNGGAEFGARGFVAGYDADTGKQKWKFFIVPGEVDRDGEVSDLPLLAARKTWRGEWWKMGGGGTPWDSMAYDPQLDLLYVGSGNGSPWNAAMRSPGGGDNLFLASIVALRPETGEFVWHFQETPGESWDYTSTQPIILADLAIGGKVRKTLLHAPKNGFFYVLDRATGKFIQGTKYSHVNWAKGLDATGRPIEVPEARFGDTGKPVVLTPGPGGAHDWQPMSFSPKTGLVYLPVDVSSYLYRDDRSEGGAGPSKFGFNTGAGNFSATVRLPSSGSANVENNAGIAGADTAAPQRESILLAWDPVKQVAHFKIPRRSSFNGGVLSTAGGLVFQGTRTGDFSAYRDDTGAKLWSFDAQTGVVAAPVSYELGGVQYVAVMAGWGGAAAAWGSRSDSNGPARLLVFKLGSKGRLPSKAVDEMAPIDPPALTAPMGVVDAGASLYSRNCARCHGISAVGGGLGRTGPADLRRSAFIQDQASFNAVVLDGLLLQNGMASFRGELDTDKTRAIRAYITFQAQLAGRPPPTR